MSDVVIVGSIVIDLIGYTKSLPKPGETVMGHRFLKGFGGKGANQCVSAKRLGGSVALVGKVGKDLLGKEYLENLSTLGIDTKFVFQSESCSTAVALITVTSSGQNSIVVIQGANFDLSVEELVLARDLVAHTRVLLCQLEVPQPVVYSALEIARANGVTTILNPAPAPTADNPMRRDMLQLLDFICPNEFEASTNTGLPLQLEDLGDADDPAVASHILERARPLLEWFVDEARKLGNSKLVPIITLGRLGVVFRSVSGSVHFVPAERVQAVDTTGAGDAFCGTLGFLLARFTVAELQPASSSTSSTSSPRGPPLPLRELIRRAVLVATRSVLAAGTQSSFPHRNQLPDEWFS